MKKTDNTSANKMMNIVVMAVLAVALVAVSLIGDAGARLWVMVAAVMGASMTMLGFCLKHRLGFDVQVQRRLKKAGLGSKMKDGNIMVKKGNLVLKACLWNRPEKGSKRVHFMLEFAPNVIDRVSAEGWAMVAAKCNACNTYTTLQYFGDHFICQVETTVKSAKDFLREYEFACAKICETMQGLEEDTKMALKMFPAAKERHVGFHVPVVETAVKEEANEVGGAAA